MCCPISSFECEDRAVHIGLFLIVMDKNNICDSSVGCFRVAKERPILDRESESNEK